MTFITADEVRNISGAPSSLISDTLIAQYITEVEAEMSRWMNTSFVPKETIEIVNGNGSPRLILKKNPVLSVRELTVNDSTSITPAYIEIYKSSGKIVLGNSAESFTFISGYNNTFIKYIYGMVEESSTDTSSSADSSAGTNVSLSVASITGFADNDWIEIYGMDGHREVSQINGTPSGTTIIVDKLVKSHESGSKIVKLQIPEFIKKYMLIEAALCCAMNALGATYTFNTSYSLGELSVTKGEPYPQWRDSIMNLLKERGMRQSRIRPRPSMVID